MSDPAAVVRAAFPKWKTDPYQKAAVDALLRILFAGENVENELGRVEVCLSYFLEDPPLSLAVEAPARQAERLAKKLEALAFELRKGAATLRGLRAYVDQFDSRPELEESHGAVRSEPYEPSVAAPGSTTTG